MTETLPVLATAEGSAEGGEFNTVGLISSRRVRVNYASRHQLGVSIGFYSDFWLLARG